MQHEDEHDKKLVRITANIIAAYVGQNGLSAPELPKLINDVHQACRSIVFEEQPKDQPEPAVPPHQSVKKDHLVCLEDGKTFKSLKRHLRAEHGMTPEEYKEKWNLSNDYPMVAPNYAETRSRLAKEMGLGGNVASQRKTAPRSAK